MGPQGLIPVFCSDATHAPVTSADQTATRIKVSWYSKETNSVELSYFVLYRAPEKFTLRIETATDGRPIRKVTFCPTGDSRQAPRAEYERRYNVKIDWDRVERTDRKISQSLKEVLPTIDSGAKP